MASQNAASDTKTSRVAAAAPAASVADSSLARVASLAPGPIQSGTKTAPAAVSQLAMLRAQQRFKDEDPEAAARLEANAKFAYACCLCTLCLSCIPLCCCTPEASKRRLVELALEEQREIDNPSAAREGGAQSPPARQAMAASDSSGNQQAIRAKELELKEKELELKERELELQEKEAAAAGN